MPKRTGFFTLFVFILSVFFLFPDEVTILEEVKLSEEAPLPQKEAESHQAFPPHAIINASYRGDEKTVREILAAGADKDVRDAIGETALHLAMFQSNVEIVKLLLDYGFDPNAVAVKNGFTPLHNAVAANNAAAARLLLQYGANKRIRCNEGYTPLDMARKREKGDMVNVLY